MAKRKHKKMKKADIERVYLEKRTPTLINYFNKFNKRKILNKEIKDLKRELTSLDNWYMRELKR